MVTLTRIYTRGGDGGETSLVDGSRVSKANPRVETFGAVDEANSAIGVARLHTSNDGAAPRTATYRSILNTSAHPVIFPPCFGTE